MLSDSQKKEQFDKIWKAKLSSSKYQFEWWGWNYSNRQVPIWSIVELKEKDKDNRIKLRVLYKPCYKDSFGKDRYRGYIVCKEVDDPSETIIIANTDDVVKVYN